MNPSFARVLINFVLFQIGWFSIVLLGASSLHLVASSIAFTIVGIHLCLSVQPQVEIKLIIFALAVGLIWESVLVAFGILEYSFGQAISFIAPHWIIAMWALFATTLNVSLRWLKGRSLLAACVGAIGGPLAFYAGFKLDAVAIPNMLTAMIILAVGWGLLTPLLVWCAERYDGFKQVSNQLD